MAEYIGQHNSWEKKGFTAKETCAQASHAISSSAFELFAKDV